MARITVLDSGTYYHHRTIHEPRYRERFDEVVYIRDLARIDLSTRELVLVSCRTDPSQLIPCREQIAHYLAGGGTVVAMGSTGQPSWLPGVVWHDTPTNFWWWKEGGSLGLEAVAPDHPLFGHITLTDATWHHHGHFDVPEGATSLIDVAGKGSVLYEDKVTTNGTMIVTALDPMYHHGSHFMPATTRFLDGFLPWLQSL